MADDGGQCFEMTVRWDSLKKLVPFMDSDTAVGVGTMADASVVLACSNVPKELVTLMGL